MDCIITNIRKFVNEHAYKDNKTELYFVQGDTIISYIHAEYIIEVVDSLRLTLKSSQESCKLYKDYSRLLRNENEQIRLNNKDKGE